MNPRQAEETRATLERRQKAKRMEAVATAQAQVPLAFESEEMLVPKSYEMFGRGFRSIPNEFVRAALFRVLSNRMAANRPRLYEEKLASMGDMEIFFTGEVLDNHVDQEVQMFIASKTFSETPEGTVFHSQVCFTSGEALHALGWDLSGFYYERLSHSIRRLSNCSIRLYTPRLGTLQQFKFFTVSAEQVPRGIPRGLDDAPPVSRDPHNKWVIATGTGMRFMYTGSHYTRLDIAVRNRLTDIGKFLYNWLMSFPSPYPTRIDTLLRLSGADTTNLSYFRRRIREAMEQLQELGVVSHWHIEGDKLNVVKTQRGAPTPELPSPKELEVG